MTLRRFEMEIDAYLEDDIPEAVLQMQRILSIAALNSLVLKSPVDTGRFRGAWMTTIDVYTLEAPSTEYGAKGSGAGAAASAAINSGVGAITGAPPFSNIVIQNNTEYGEDLEDGSSTQAPAGILAITVAELEGMFR